ncbi:hypothetical protein [Streptomyces poriticola]|uniref:hypothetical protein n=1 Tax=Streptomyces poriticola TaxID=3120506 RepID=UPI002FCE62A4
MTRLAVRRTALAASAAALALLATACGGSSADGGDKAEAGGGKAEAEKTTAAAEALTADELEKAALTQADVKSGKVATAVPAGDDVARDQVTADDAACLPLALAQAGVAQGEPSATVKRSYTGEAEEPAADTPPEEAMMAALDVEKVLVTLSSHEGGAEGALKELSTAAEKCSGGYTATAVGEPMKIVKVAVDEAPAAGDEALALTLTLDTEEGPQAPQKVVVVRKGATLASFSAVNLAAMATGKDFEIPAELVDAQVGKLG